MKIAINLMILAVVTALGWYLSGRLTEGQLLGSIMFLMGVLGTLPLALMLGAQRPPQRPIANMQAIDAPALADNSEIVLHEVQPGVWGLQSNNKIKRKGKFYVEKYCRELVRAGLDKSPSLR